MYTDVRIVLGLHHHMYAYMCSSFVSSRGFPLIHAHTYIVLEEPELFLTWWGRGGVGQERGEGVFNGNCWLLPVATCIHVGVSQDD